jgi:hypothetical protein
MMVYNRIDASKLGTEYAICGRDMNATLNSKHEGLSERREGKSVTYLIYAPYHETIIWSKNFQRFLPIL